MEFQRIRYETRDRRAFITLSRPEKRNALDDLMVRELSTAFAKAARAQQVKVVVLAAEGSSFCSGADLEYLNRLAKFDLEENRADSHQLATLFRTIYELRKPTIAVVNGPALAGGCGLATVCDIVVASRENARFGYTEVRIGFIPAVVMVFLMKRVGEGRARELILRGNIIDADSAMQMGLVNAAVPQESLESTVMALSDEMITLNSAYAMGLCKEMMAKLHGMNLTDSLDFAANMNAAARMSQDCKTGVNAFLKKEKPEW